MYTVLGVFLSYWIGILRSSFPYLVYRDPFYAYSG
jgi:hypothetical protein